jgi:uncharacterized protein YyaL (SSP411 family)
LHLDPDGLAAHLQLDPADIAGRVNAARRRLYELRSKRIWPGLDDKVLTSWNGLVLGALAEGGQSLGRPDYLDAAVTNAGFLHRTMRSDSGRLARAWRAGSSAKHNACLEDYACLADGLLALYEATFDQRWVEWATELADLMLAHFHDEKNGGFFDTSDDHEELIHRPKDLQDNAMPSGNSMAASVLLRLALLTGHGDYWQLADQSTATMTGLMSQYPSGFGHWLNAASFILGEPREIALVGSTDELGPLLEVVRRGYRPFQVVAAGTEAEGASVPLLRDRPRAGGRATAYVCRKFVCQAPVNDPRELARQLELA